MDEYLEFVDDVVDELGCAKEIEYIRRILETAPAPTASCRSSSETGDLQRWSTSSSRRRSAWT